MNNLKSWGNYPINKSVSNDFHLEKKELNFKKNTIPYGNGRSYGDSCLSKHILMMRRYNHILSFNNNTGLLNVQSGVLLEDIISIFLPKGWFLRVTPGTKFITIGGAIASDIHGKNHHIDGCFSEHVHSFKLLLPNGDIKNCEKKENEELFHATCGGMGLTGIITEVKIKLKKVHSGYINQTTIKSKDLKETFDIFERIKSEQYSVAWIDCMSKGKKLGRGHVIYGDFSEDGNLTIEKKHKINIPFFFPSFILNSYTVRLFNWFYYHKIIGKRCDSKVNYNSFFFPLDSIENWNNIYGKAGFTQYQFILPINESYQGLKDILTEISKSGKGSFLAVLKLYGKENKNYLSFPIEGYSLALDFKIDNDIFELLNRLDNIVTKYKGRIYLSKDVRVSKEVFEKGYPKINKFREIRNKYNLKEVLTSLQSERVGI